MRCEPPLGPRRLPRRRLGLRAPLLIALAGVAVAFAGGRDIHARAQLPQNPAGGVIQIGRTTYAAGRLLVRFRPGVLVTAQAAVHAAEAGEVVRTFASVPSLQLVQLPAGMSVEDAVARYQAQPDVLYAEPDYIVSAIDGDAPAAAPRGRVASFANDPRFGELWGLDNTGQIVAGLTGVPDADIDAPEAWAITTGSRQVVVAVIDTGVDYRHPDLQGNLWRNEVECTPNGIDDDGNGYIDDCYGIDTFNNDSDPFDDHYHGTHVSGTIGARADNGIGVAGVNWNVSIVACKFLGAGGFGFDSGAVACLDYLAGLVDRGVPIVASNNSWGGGGYSQALGDAIAAQQRRGILFIAAAGNSTSNNDVSDFFPANYFVPNLVSVAATMSADGRARFSSYGPRTAHLSAPGQLILSTVPGGTYGYLSGTSMATPHVTGVAALLKAQDPTRDWRTIRNLLLTGGDPKPSQGTVTGRRLNAAGSLQCTTATVQARLRPLESRVTGNVGVPIPLAALHVTCGAAAGEVSVAVRPGTGAVTLRDDGVAPDQATGDGSYAGLFVPAAAGTYTLTFGPDDVMTVQVLPSTYRAQPGTEPYRTITGTALDVADEDPARLVAPFLLRYGGGTFDAVYVSDNGLLRFERAVPRSFAVTQSMPTTAVSTLIAPLWMDLYPTPETGQTVYWAVQGTAPSRELVIEWRNLTAYTPCGDDTQNTVRFQVVLFEDRDDVLFNYADVSFGGVCTAADGGGLATVGVQVGLTRATQFSRNQVALTDGMSIRWVPTSQVTGLTGTVTDAVTGRPLIGVGVTIYSATGTEVAKTTTWWTGGYLVEGLSPGAYYVKTSNGAGYVDEVYDRVLCQKCTVTTGTPVTATLGQITSGINFALSQGGAVTGTVTASTGAGVKGMFVQVFTASGVLLSTAETASTGRYTARGLAPGTYYVKTLNTLGYMDELFNHVPCVACAVTTGTPVQVAFAQTTSEINFSLAQGGSVTGTVTDGTTGAPLAGVLASVYTSSDAYVTGVQTTSTGSYTVRGLPAGNYFIKTTNGQGYIDEVYDNVRCIGCTVTAGTPVPVTLEHVTSGLDFALTRGGSVSGTVTAVATGAVLAGVTVQVFPLDGAWVNTARTTPSGSYTVGALPTGSYYVRTSNNLGYIDETFDHVPCVGCPLTAGTPVAVTLGQPTSGINFALGQGGTVTGTVTASATGAGLAGVMVQVYTASGASVMATYTTPAGAYTVSGLATGSYRVKTTNTLGYIDEVYDDVPCVTCSVVAGTPVSVSVGQVTSGISFALAQGGAIAGKVTASATGAVLAGVPVDVYTRDGLFVTRVQTAETGSYAAGGLTAGTYYLKTTNSLGYIDEAFDDVPCTGCAATIGTPVVVALGQTTSGINFALAQGGAIAGTVTASATGAGLAGVYLTVYTATGAYAASALTTATGSYTVSGLPPGSYYLRSSNTLGYIDEVFDNVPCVGCTVTTGTLVAVTPPQTASGINFALAQGGAVSGTVTASATGAALPGVSVLVYTTDNAWVTSVQTTAGGSYTVGGLTTGTYYVKTAYTVGYVDELYDNVPCVDCALTTGTPVSVVLGQTTSAINLALAASPAIAPQLSSGRARYAADRVLVRFRPGVLVTAQAAVHAAEAGAIVRTFDTVPSLQLVQLPAGVSVEDAVARYQAQPDVLYAEPDYIVSALDGDAEPLAKMLPRLAAERRPNDPLFGELWGLDNTGQTVSTQAAAPDADIDAPEAWAITTGSRQVVVAVIDTGVDYKHPDLQGNLWRNEVECTPNGIDDDGDGYIDDCYGIDTFNSDGDPFDDQFHGTHVSGTIGARGDNGIGVTGVNWNVSIVACKFLGSNGVGATSGALACLDWIAGLVDRGVPIVASSNSWGGGGYSQSLVDAIAAQQRRGVLFIVAAGNGTANNDISDSYPANYFLPNVVSVAATMSADGRARFSNYGPRTAHLSAPGQLILSTVPDGKYGYLSGTSMATPHVTGVAALLKAQDPTRDWRAIRNLLLTGGDPKPSQGTITGRRLNAAGSMQCTTATVRARLRPQEPRVVGNVGVPIPLAALHLTCAAPAGAVTVAIEPGHSTVTLQDNGVAPDQTAGDGSYAGLFVPAVAGTYTLTFGADDVLTVQVLASTYAAQVGTERYRTITGTALEVADEVTAKLAAPFPLRFGGGTFDAVYVSDNGLLRFERAVPGTFYATQVLPTTAVSTLIAPLWMDLYPTPETGQTVYWAVQGTAPARELVIEWRNLTTYTTCGDDAQNTVRFQVVLFEDRDDVLFNYADVSFGGVCTAADGAGLATVGVQVGQTRATQFSRNQVALTDGMSIRWIPVGAPASLSPSALFFAGTKDGASGDLKAVTGSQDVTLTFGGAGSGWTATANQPWLQITNGSGTGNGRFTVGITNAGNVLGASTSLTGTITVTAPGAGNSPISLPVTLRLDQSGGAATTAPFGQVDTPAQNLEGVVGAVGMTGWALDDVGVTSVKIYRNCLSIDASENCQVIGGNRVVFVGDAVFLAGARPDVEAAYGTSPQSYRAGWGYLLLTNMLPHVAKGQGYGGQGRLTLYAYASDADGHVGLLGRSPTDQSPTSITLANDNIAKPFGSIDVPAPGATLSGTSASFGWVLTPDSNTTADSTDVMIPPSGSTTVVFIDGVATATVAYNQCRGNVGNPVPATIFCNDDVADIFGNASPQPVFTTRTTNPTPYRNLDAGRAAIGAYSIDTTRLSNGVHSLAWGVTDSAGRVEGIGSRFFTVLNGGAADQLQTSNFKLQTPERNAVGASVRTSIVRTSIWGRIGFDLAAAFVPIPFDTGGVRHVSILELGRVEVSLGPGFTAGYLVANGTLRDLPPGASLDPETGVFTWMPAPGYIGEYHLMFVRGGEQLLIDVMIRPIAFAP